MEEDLTVPAQISLFKVPNFNDIIPDIAHYLVFFPQMLKSYTYLSTIFPRKICYYYIKTEQVFTLEIRTVKGFLLSW